MCQGQKAYKGAFYTICHYWKKLFKIGLFKTIFLQLPRCCALFPGFNTHYVSSIFQFNLRIFTKHVRGLLSSILNAIHHGIIPCALAQFFATTHHVERSSAHFSAHALPLFKAAAWRQAHSFCNALLKLHLSKPSKLPCPTFPGRPCLPTPAPTLILPQHCLLVVCPPSQIPSEDVPSKEEHHLAL